VRPEQGAPKFILRLDHEKQKDRNKQGENAQAFSECNADKDSSKLAIGGSWIAQGTQKELTKNYSDAYRGRPRTDRGETCAY
jgi:hypothetical protein